MPVDFVQREFFPRLDRLNEIGEQRCRLRQFTELFREIRNIGLEVFGEFALRTGDEGGRGLLVLPVEDDFTAVGIFQRNPAPGKNGVGILRAGIGFDLHRALVVLAENVLNRIEVMLPHIAKPAAVVIPVAAKGLVNAMRVVWFLGAGPSHRS